MEDKTHVLPLEHDCGQTDSRVPPQRLSTAHHKVTWLILIRFKYSIANESNVYLCVKGKVTVNVTCQCSENSYFWRVIDHKYLALCWVACTASSIPQHITLKLLSLVCVERTCSFIVIAEITHFLRDNKAVHKNRRHF